MPNPQSILANLTMIANEATTVAIVWHGLTLIAVVALVIGWRPSRRRAGALLAAPVASASLVAFVYGNPFNGVLLGGLAVALIGIASRLGSRPVERGSTVSTAMGVATIAFGWLYPHFLESGAASRYLFAAPTGLIPCPTLSLVIGFALLAGGLGSRTWSLALALVGLFYGLFGVARLGVPLDVILTGSAAGLLVVALALPRRRSHAAALRDASAVHVRRTAPIP